MSSMINRIPFLKAAADRLYPAVIAIRTARGSRNIRHYLKERKRKAASGPIRVGFIAQVPEVWDKQLSLFEYMLRDARFDPSIIYINHYDFANQRFSEEDPRDRLFYEERYGEDRILDFFSSDTFDLESYDYLFYDRPFNHYLPAGLQTLQASRHSRLCHILYGAYDWDVPFDYRDFAAGVSLWFASNIHEYNAHRQVFGTNNLHQVFDVGYPAYELYHSLSSTPGCKRVLWTPRWGYGEGIGGSHFLEYIDYWINYASCHDISLVIRPHPLMFDNMIRENLMSQADIDLLMERCTAAGIRFDHNRIVADTFRNTDILVSDYSSILGLFLAMDKPIVYCPAEIPLAAEFRQQMEAMYQAPAWENIEQHLDRLLAGEDPLAEKRQAVINDCLLKKRDAAEHIAEIVAQDYKLA